MLSEEFLLSFWFDLVQLVQINIEKRVHSKESLNERYKNSCYFISFDLKLLNYPKQIAFQHVNIDSVSNYRFKILDIVDVLFIRQGYQNEDKSRFC